MTTPPRRPVRHFLSTFVVPESTTGSTVGGIVEVEVPSGACGVIVGVHDADHLVVTLDDTTHVEREGRCIELPTTLVLDRTTIVVTGRRPTKENHP